MESFSPLICDEPLDMRLLLLLLFEGECKFITDRTAADWLAVGELGGLAIAEVADISRRMFDPAEEV